MLVTIKNGKRTLALNATERRQMAAVKDTFAMIGRDYVAADTQLEKDVLQAAITMGQLLQITAPEPTPKPAEVADK
jgi:hypothetical protein